MFIFAVLQLFFQPQVTKLHQNCTKKQPLLIFLALTENSHYILRYDLDHGCRTGTRVVVLETCKTTDYQQYNHR